MLIDEFQHVPEILDAIKAKVHVIDSGLAGWLLGLSAAKIARRVTEFGHLAETFAVGEILKQVSWSEEVATAAYFRTQDGDEVDLVLETWDGRVAGFEMKAGSRVQDVGRRTGLVCTPPAIVLEDLRGPAAGEVELPLHVVPGPDGGCTTWAKRISR